MRFAIVGAGGMGGAVAAFLARSGREVMLIGRNPMQAEEIRRQGLQVEVPSGENLVAWPAASAHPHQIPARSIDTLIVLTKSFDTAAALTSLRHILGHRGVAVTIQNGLGNEMVLADAFGAERTLYGVTTIGGRLLGPNRVSLTNLTARNNSLTQIGPLVRTPGLLETAKRLADTLSASGLPTEAMDDVAPAVWAKLVVAAMGPLGSIVRRPVIDVWTNPEGRALLRRMFDEVVDVAVAEGVRLDREAVWAHAGRTWEGTGSYLNSMNLDVLQRRRTEIDTIAAEVVRRAERHGVPVPMHDVVVRMMRLIEATYDRAW